MKFLYKDISTALEWKENEIPVLIIENIHLFNRLVIDVYEQLELGYEKNFSLLNEQDKNVEKEAKFILEPFSLTINNKDVQLFLNKLLLNSMKETYIDLDEKLKPIHSFYSNAFLDLPLDIEIDANFNQKTLAKLFTYVVHDDSETIIEKVYNYTNVMTDLSIANIFIFVNLKQYLSKSEYNNFINFIKVKKINILLIENRTTYSNENEKILIIDKDLCELL